MFNNIANCKRAGLFVIFLLVIFFNFPTKFGVVFAVSDDSEQVLNDNIDSILNDIDFSELDNFSYNVYDGFSFKEMAQDIINGKYFSDYNSLFSYIKSIVFDNFKLYLRFFISLFIISLLHLLFKFFSSDKYLDLNFTVKIIFSFLVAISCLSLLKTYSSVISSFVDDLFSFINILFPILLSLITLSGATTTSSVFGSFSVFLVNTGSYVLKFVLLPLAISILLLSVFSSIFMTGRISKLIDIFKMIFKYTIIIFIGVFGFFSSASIFSSSVADGINLKLTKFAIKNYVPVLGGYISDGFDFFKGCSVLIKNSIGVCSIFFLLYFVLKPLVFTFVLSLGFKILSAATSFSGDQDFTNIFDDISKSLSNFLTIIVGSFALVVVFIFLLIMSVGVI